MDCRFGLKMKGIQVPILMGILLPLISSIYAENLKVTSILTEPFLFPARDGANHTGNDQYEGYGVDLLEKLAQKLNFTYEITLVPDNKYGSATEDGKWTGIMGHLIDRKADLAVSEMSITPQRSQVVDFTVPFLNATLSIVLKRHGQTVFHDTASTVVPNLAYPITKAEDLVNQEVINYGVVRGGSTEAFFKQSTDPLYKKIWENMSAKPNASFVNNYDEGLSRVFRSNGKYAFFMESNAADYAVRTRKWPKKVCTDISPRGFGIATPTGSALTGQISAAILELQQSGYLQEIYEKWYHSSACKMNS